MSSITFLPDNIIDDNDFIDNGDNDDNDDNENIDDDDSILGDEIGVGQQFSSSGESPENQDICAICHEEFSGDLYTLPECSHIFHTNCIMTWFRMNKSTCPLCNNCGVNSVKDMEKISWGRRNNAFIQYKRLRAFSRRKNAPKELKDKIARIKKYEDKEKKFFEDFKKFKNSKPDSELTVNEIIKKYNNMRRKKWKMRWDLRKKKQLIGFTSNNITNIIIPIKKYYD